MSEDKKTLEFYNDFDYKKETGEPGAKVPVEALTFPDGYTELNFLPQFY